MMLISSFMIFFLFFVIYIACIRQEKLAQKGQFPYQVSIRNRDDRNRHIGGGVIITTKLILTSASVVYFIECPKSIDVVAGTIYLDISGTFIKIEKCTVHPSFKYGKITSDIALLHTALNVTFSETIQPVRLPSLDMLIEKEIKVNAPSWGRYN